MFALADRGRRAKFTESVEETTEGGTRTVTIKSTVKLEPLRDLEAEAYEELERYCIANGYDPSHIAMSEETYEGLLKVIMGRYGEPATKPTGDVTLLRGARMVKNNNLPYGVFQAGTSGDV